MPPSTNYTHAARCGKCNKFLAYLDGRAEIKCPRCGVTNVIDPNNMLYQLEYNPQEVNLYAAIVGGSA